MAATQVTVVEIDGLWFRFQKLRGRRATRGAAAFRGMLGGGSNDVLANPDFWAFGRSSRVEAFTKLMSMSRHFGGRAYVPDEFERDMVEIVHWARDQGVSYSDTELAADEKGWAPIKNLDSLDGYDQVDHATWMAILWESTDLTFRPTAPASGMSAATPEAGTTVTEASPPSGTAPSPATGARVF